MRWWCAAGEAYPRSTDLTAIASTAGRVDVFGVDRVTGAIVQNYWTGSGWSGGQNLGGATADPVVAVAGVPGEIDLFVRGLDGAVYTRVWTGTQWLPANNVWAPIPGGGVLGGEPTVVVRDAGTIDLFGSGVLTGASYSAPSFHTSGSWELLRRTVTSCTSSSGSTSAQASRCPRPGASHRRRSTRSRRGSARARRRDGRATSRCSSPRRR